MILYTVYSTISYGAAIWGNRRFSCISAAQNIAARFYMRVGRNTPTAAVMGDMGSTNTVSRQNKCIINQWFRLRSMDENRLNSIVFNWANSQGRIRFQNCACVLSSNLGNVISKFFFLGCGDSTY